MEKLLLDRAQLLSWHADIMDAHETITHAAPLVFEHGGDALFQQYAVSVRRLLSMAQDSGVFVGIYKIYCRVMRVLHRAAQVTEVTR